MWAIKNITINIDEDDNFFKWAEAQEIKDLINCAESIEDIETDIEFVVDEMRKFRKKFNWQFKDANTFWKFFDKELEETLSAVL